MSVAISSKCRPDEFRSWEPYSGSAWVFARLSCHETHKDLHVRCLLLFISLWMQLILASKYRHHFWATRKVWSQEREISFCGHRWLDTGCHNPIKFILKYVHSWTSILDGINNDSLIVHRFCAHREASSSSQQLPSPQLKSLTLCFPQTLLQMHKSDKSYSHSPLLFGLGTLQCEIKPNWTTSKALQ